MTPVAPLPRDLKFFLIATLALALALAAARQWPGLVFAPADLHFDIARNLLHSGTFGRTPGGHTLVRGRFVVFDLDSTGGTWVNGVRIQQAALTPGDVISLAGLPLIYGQDQDRMDHTQDMPTDPLGNSPGPGGEGRSR